MLASGWRVVGRRAMLSGGWLAETMVLGSVYIVAFLFLVFLSAACFYFQFVILQLLLLFTLTFISYFMYMSDVMCWIWGECGGRDGWR